MKNNCDIVILVGEKITKPIKDGLKEVKFNNKNIYVVIFISSFVFCKSKI